MNKVKALALKMALNAMNDSIMALSTCASTANERIDDLEALVSAMAANQATTNAIFEKRIDSLEGRVKALVAALEAAEVK